MNKRIIIMSAVLAAAGAVAVVGTQSVTNAASAHPAKGGIVHRIGDKNAHVRLNQAERDGTITAAQKTAFISEVKTLRTERKNTLNKTSTAAQRQTERATLKSELQAWARINNFPLAKLFPKLAA